MFNVCCFFVFFVASSTGGANMHIIILTLLQQLNLVLYSDPTVDV